MVSTLKKSQAINPFARRGTLPRSNPMAAAAL